MKADLYSWFLGPKAENAGLLEELVLEAVRDCVFWRRNFHPEDESLIPAKLMHDESYQDAVATLRQEFWSLLAGLKRDVPFYSPRYIGHMLGDQLLPATLGYFAAMLHNPNNISPEAAPITTKYELEVAEQLGHLMGWDGEVWGHITSGGTIANFEAMWVARNLKYLPLAARAAARALSLGDLHYTTASGEERSLCYEDDVWSLLNLSPEAGLSLRRALWEACVQHHPTTSPRALLEPFTLSSLGIQRFFSQPALVDIPPGVIIVPATAHYSLGKVAETLGLGKQQLLSVPVDHRFRMDVGALERVLEDCLATHTPVIAVVAVMGNTEEGAVDPIHRVVALREKMAARGLQFHFHCDAAWGGYVRTLMVDEYDRPVARADELSRMVRGWPREDVFASLQAVHNADSVTIDPHKLGSIPYPCGVVVFKHQEVKELIAFEAPYIGSQMDEDDGRASSLGHYIFEGSKPGAAAASAWLAHRVVPLNHKGYGRLIGKSMEGAHEIYLKFRDALKPELAEVGITLQLLTDPPDLNLICFAVNLEDQPDLKVMNRISHKIYDALRFNPDEVLQRHAFMISKTSFSADHYGLCGSNGQHSMHQHLEALGIAPGAFEEVGAVTVLRSTVLDPWLALSRGHRTDYVVEFAACLAQTIKAIARPQSRI